LKRQKAEKDSMKKLQRQKKCLCVKLKKHFMTPVNKRNYPEFEKIVNELDELRTKLRGLSCAPNVTSD